MLRFFVRGGAGPFEGLAPFFFFDNMGIILGLAAYYTYVIPECFYRESRCCVTTDSVQKHYGMTQHKANAAKI